MSNEPVNPISENQWKINVSMSLAVIETRLATMVADAIGARTTMRRIESNLRGEDRELARKLEAHMLADAEGFEKVSIKISKVEKNILLLVGGIIGIEAIIVLGLQIYQALK